MAYFCNTNLEYEYFIITYPEYQINLEDFNLTHRDLLFIKELIYGNGGEKRILT